MAFKLLEADHDLKQHPWGSLTHHCATAEATLLQDVTSGTGILALLPTVNGLLRQIPDYVQGIAALMASKLLEADHDLKQHASRVTSHHCTIAEATIQCLNMQVAKPDWSIGIPDYSV